MKRDPRLSSAFHQQAFWTPDEFARIGSVMASDSVERGPELTSVLDHGLSGRIGSKMLIRLIGKLVLDDPRVTSSVGDLALFGRLVSEGISALPKRVQDRLQGLYWFNDLLAQAEQGLTFGLTRRMARLNAPITARAMVQRDLLNCPSTDGGAAGVIAELRELARRPTVKDPEDVLWDSYLKGADLYGVAERIGGESVACAAGAARVMTLNARSAMILDRAEALSDRAAVTFAKGLVRDAWITQPALYTRNLQMRIARITRDTVDREILMMMDDFLVSAGTHE